jgi:hypothetical protein
MPHTRDPDPISPRHSAVPLCSACGKEMRLILAKPDDHFVNLDDCTYRCDCGEEGQYVRARAD